MIRKKNFQKNKISIYKEDNYNNKTQKVQL